MFAAIFAGAAVCVHTIVRRFLPPPERLSEHHEVAGFIMGVVGVLYSVVLGFLVGTVWTAFASAQQNADLEAGYVADAFNFAGQLPRAQGLPIQRAIAGYAIALRDESWSGAQPSHADPTAPFIYEAVRLSFAPPSRTYANPAAILEANSVRGALVDALRKLGDARRLRFVQAQGGLPPGMLEALLLGAIAVVAFTFLFGVRSYVKQMTMTALLAGSIGLFFGLIIDLSTPYSGPIHVSRDALRIVIANNHLDEFSR